MDFCLFAEHDLLSANNIAGLKQQMPPTVGLIESGVLYLLGNLIAIFIFLANGPDLKLINHAQQL